MWNKVASASESGHRPHGPQGAPGYFSVADLAFRYSVHAETIRRWIRSGLLASLKLPGGHRVPLVAVEAFERERLTRSGGS